MTARIAVSQMRAARAEDLQDLWAAIWEDGACSPAERDEFGRLLQGAVSDWSEQVLELAFVTAFIGGGLPATENRDTRVSKLAREAERNGEDWARDLERLTA